MNDSALVRDLEERFLRYVRVDTQSDEASSTSPSTRRQFDLLEPLAEELRAAGARDVTVSSYGAVLATIPATSPAPSPTVAFLAHVDTSPAFSGAGVRPIVHRAYGGGEIALPDAPDLVLSPERSPYLGARIGEDIVTASGTTLLGADDKAGVAIVMTLAAHLLANPDLVHGTIRVCFTPDEEIGRGVHRDLPRDLLADVAYTLDGAERGEIVYETFSADRATVRIEGVSAHPGQAKDRMVNAARLAARMVETLPPDTPTPETTAGREGFVHLYQTRATPAVAELTFALRDFELDGLRAKGTLVERACAVVRDAEPRARVDCAITPQYRNMRYWLEEDMRPVELAMEACRQVGVEPFSTPTRGGTDGSRLTELGIPCPNLFTGMQEIHGPTEWVSLHDMACATQVCVRLARLWAG